jgi:two-component system chemotaxis response regulator CheB
MSEVFLLPGEMAYSGDPGRISTLLGSCVAVVLHDARLKRGGMNHFMVPTAGPNSSLNAGKCGDLAIAQLLRLAGLAGSRNADLGARLYGGGAVVGHLGSAAVAGGLDIGRRNIELARKMLHEAGVRILAEETGGTQGRRLSLDPVTGQVEVRLIESSRETKEKAELAGRLTGRRARVLVVDDSATVRRLIAAVIADSPELEVCGEAEDPFAARELLLDLDPDVLCLDIIMPRMDGVTFLKRIMQFKPIPTVIVSTIAKQGSEMRAKALAAGAVAVIDKEELDLYRGREAATRMLLPQLLLAARTVVKRRDGQSDGR